MVTLKKHKRLLLFFLTCLVLCSFTLANVVDAAVGHSTSHGSSSSSSGSTSSSRSFSSSSSSSSTGSASTGEMPGGMLVAVIAIVLAAIIIVIVVIVSIFKTRKGPITEEYQSMMDAVANVAAAASIKEPAYLRQALAELAERDPEFSEDLFISRVNNMFVQLQEAWQAKDWKKVRPFESDELFNMHARQLQELIDSHTTNVVDEIAILKTLITDYHYNGTTESLDVYMRVRYKDYIMDDNTGKVVEGDPNREITMEYELVMSRKKGVITRLAQNTVVSTCPNCGANVSINASGECEYCGSVVSNGDFDWVLTRLDVLSQI